MKNNIQLFLGDLEVELNDKISFPISKTYESLNNPLDIVVDYSKSINIPITENNNIILGNLFRLDKTIPTNNNSINIGFYLDPSKKIPFRLMYNHNLILEGYAKFLSTTNSKSNKYYTITLFGALGDIFQKLKNIVLDDSKLTESQQNEDDRGQKYVLNDNLTGQPLSIGYVYNTFRNNPLNIQPLTGVADATLDYSIIGFAPAYRGYYNDFNSSKIQTNTDTSVDMSEYVFQKWKSTYKTSHPSATDEEVEEYVNSLDIEDVIGDGFKDYEMDEYRYYQMRPYIFFNKLMYMYMNKLKEISDYSIELDDNWFNANNPYWTKLCYMLDYLEQKGTSNTVSNLISNNISLQYTSSDFNNYCAGTVNKTYNIPTNLLNSNGLELNLLKIITKKGLVLNSNETLDFKENTCFKMDIVLSNSNTTSTKTLFFAPNPQTAIFPLAITQPTFYQLDIKRYWEGTRYILEGSFIAPSLYFDGDYSTDTTLSISISIYNNERNSYGTVQPYIAGGSEMTGVATYLNYVYDSIVIDKVEVETNINTNIPIKLYNLYRSDTPLFNVILQYTKMFGLIWDIDYSEHKIYVKTKHTYFENYTIEDWSNNIDITNEYKLEIPLFNTKYIDMNYDETDGYRYSGYFNKYNSVYGSKRLSTDYDFNNESKNLISDIKPSCSSNRVYIPFSSIYNWNLSNVIPSQTDPVIRMEESDEDDSSAISGCNWYLRGVNKSVSKYYITKDSQLQTSEERCYYSKEWLDSLDSSSLSLYARSFTSLPQFNIVYSQDDDQFIKNSVGCIINKPNEDYTTNRTIARTDNYIYDLVWDKYLKERYNPQNKKLTTYINISPYEFAKFKFNKFIVIDNQLFIINKIFDYDINSSPLTKCELIQVSDINNYKVGNLFDVIVTSVDNIYINSSDYGNYTIDIRSYEVPTISLVTFTNTSVNVSIVNVSTASSLYKTTVVINYNNLGANDSYNGYLRIALDKTVKIVPITIIGSAVSEVGKITSNTSSINIVTGKNDGYKTTYFYSNDEITRVLLTSDVLGVYNCEIEDWTYSNGECEVVLHYYDALSTKWSGKLTAYTNSNSLTIPITITGTNYKG